MIKIKKCIYLGCDKEVLSKGYCSTHYNRFLVTKQRKGYGNKLKFEIDKNGCFNCTSHKPNSKGYPIKNGSTLTRFIYRELFGEIPKGHVIRHKCDNRLCINPEHIITGTPKQNTQDMLQRNREARGSRRPDAKLNEGKVLEILRLLKEGEHQYKIAEKYKVSRSAILNIRLGKTWKHVPGERPTVTKGAKTHG